MPFKTTSAPQSRRQYAGFSALLLLVGVMAFGSLSPAIAQSASSREQAIAMAQQQAGGGGRVLSVREDTSADGKRYYTVKIITNGRVRVIRIAGQ